MDEKNDFQIILENVDANKQNEAAKFLSNCFSLPLPSAKRIAASAPIALLSGLGKGRSEAIMREIAAAVPEGVSVQFAPESVELRISRLEWPHPPKVYGREITDFSETPATSRQTKCPACGCRLAVNHATDGTPRLSVLGTRRGEGYAPNPEDEASDKDPLFSGFKPLATGTSDLASVQSLNAGDTGFWLDVRNTYFPSRSEADQARDTIESQAGGTSTGSLGAMAKRASGLAAFMKPGPYALVLARTRDAQAIKMTAEIMGISESEAQDRCLELGLCVARGIGLEEARTLMTRYKGAGARARIARPM